MRGSDALKAHFIGVRSTFLFAARLIQPAVSRMAAYNPMYNPMESTEDKNIGACCWALLTVSTTRCEIGAGPYATDGAADNCRSNTRSTPVLRVQEEHCIRIFDLKI